MSKTIYVLDRDEEKEYHYNITEDTVIYHFSINSGGKVDIHLVTEGVSLYYYYNNINYSEHTFTIDVVHDKSHTHSEVFNHGVNVGSDSLTYYVNGIVPKTSFKCICNQENQILNLKDGKSTIWPNLLIDNYDVDSNHGAYIGKFNEEKIFYMMSRGLSYEEANRLLLNGFLLNSDSIDFNQISDFVEEIEKI